MGASHGVLTQEQGDKKPLLGLVWAWAPPAKAGAEVVPASVLEATPLGATTSGQGAGDDIELLHAVTRSALKNPATGAPWDVTNVPTELPRERVD